MNATNATFEAIQVVENGFEVVSPLMVILAFLSAQYIYSITEINHCVFLQNIKLQ